MNENELLIWWTGQAECEAIVDDVEIGAVKLPGYIKKEFQDRLGRSGRGRLWIAPKIKLDGIEWDDKNPIAEQLGNMAGIVFLKKDWPLIQNLPGIVTGTRLNVVSNNALQNAP
jgi:hypothetical protein